MLDATRRAVANGQPIVIFPQGTRVAPGARKPYRGGLARIYAEAGLPIIPVALNSGLFWPRHAFRKRSGTVTVQVLEPIPSGLPPKEAVRQLEERLEAASNALLASGDHTLSS